MKRKDYKRLQFDFHKDSIKRLDELIQMINAGVIGEIVNIKSADGDIVKIIVE